jgi:RimJ/RimL family protein N-acetyltransferase
MHLREVLDADLPVLFAQQKDAEAAKMAHFPSREWGAFLVHWRENVLGNPAVVARTIEVEGEVAGYVASWQPAEGPREVGYWLGRAHWGRGLASAALSRFLTVHELRRPLVALVATHNVASRRVLEKCGFRWARHLVAPDGVAEIELRL